MYIKSVLIRNIRSVAKFKMAFEVGVEAGWHVLIGENGSGETTIPRVVPPLTKSKIYPSINKNTPAPAKYPNKANHEIRFTYQKNSMRSMPITATPAAEPMMRIEPPVPAQ
jgi:recombinational DNA repair ATPase RecF